MKATKTKTNIELLDSIRTRCLGDLRNTKFHIRYRDLRRACANAREDVRITNSTSADLTEIRNSIEKLVEEVKAL